MVNIRQRTANVWPVREFKANGTGTASDPFVPVHDVFIQDQHSETIDIYLCNHAGTTAPTVAAAVGVTQITVADDGDAILYGCIDITENGRFFQSLVGDITDNVITFKSPLDFAITTDAVVSFGQWDLSTANGSLVSPVMFHAGPPAGVVWDVYTLSLSISDATAMDDLKFGGITALTNGFYARAVNGQAKNLFLVSNNRGFREYGFDTDYPSKVPTGSYAFWATKNYHEKNGVCLRLDGDSGDRIEIPVVDNLTDLTDFSFSLHGHEVV